MSILGKIGYSQTYYYNAATNMVTAKNGLSQNIANCLNGKAPDDLNKYDKAELTAIEAFLRMKGSGENSIWNKLNAVEGRDGVYEFTYTLKEGNSSIEVNDEVVYQEEFSLIPKRKIDIEKGPLPAANDGPPYSFLADENGIIEYNGVTFKCDYDKNWLCLGDMSNMDDVIRIPMSNGGCLMVNRDNINDLSKAIGMFSPEDVNAILRALKMDAKIQEMKKEIDEMEEGIGKTNSEEYAQSAEEAEEAAQKSGKTGGFNGYEEGLEETMFALKDWQLELLTKDVMK